jgi:hypothetical protein
MGGGPSLLGGQGTSKEDAEQWLRQLFPNANVSVQRDSPKAGQPYAGYGGEVNGDYEAHGKGRPANVGPAGYQYFREAEAAGKGGGRDPYAYDYVDPQHYRDVARLMQRPPDGGRGRYADVDRARYEEMAKPHSRQAAMMASQKKPVPRMADAEADARRAGPAGSALWMHDGLRHPAYGYGAGQAQEQYMRDALNARIPHLSAGYDSRGYPPQMDWSMRGDWHDDYDQYASNGKGHPHQRHGKASGKMS